MEQRSQAPHNVHFHNAHPSIGDSRGEVRQGLRASPKRINPKWFYDQAGSALFEQITRLPEYYPTRTEVSILQNNRVAIADHCGRGCVLIEPGSGNCEKARLLLDALEPSAYVPLDISADFLLQAANQLGHEYPGLHIHAVCADFNDDWQLQGSLPEGRRVVFYPGSTIGNLEPLEAERFLSRVRRLVGDNGGMLVGVDLHKSSARLNAAYNDASGVTAAFNLNVLQRINALLRTNFDPESFRHRAFYNEVERRIEMYLVSTAAQRVRGDGLDIEFAEGETIHTENSYKYSVDSFAALAADAGFELQQSWLDSDELFSVHFLAAS
ncbi:MAG: L-histidine N(alpha)-methyltransferase [Pseudomonadota bacterium]